ncbi:MAG: TatD family hydrolase, partial [Candidatus Eisenbacteria bacterium]|nr:TatD family hydrolase [Candidatus Eisenbacteria bacterium]
EDVLSIAEDEGAGEVGGVMHCFPGDERYARRVIDAGFHVGVGGPVTFSSSGRLKRVAETVPLSRLLLETDSPWLAPAPHRGKRNEPAYVGLVAERIADMRGMSIKDIARVTTGNSSRLFGFPETDEDPAVAYEMWGNLYLNITNRCTNHCRFCIRDQTDTLWGYRLRLDEEPSVEQVMQAIGDPSRYREIVFCGYGEPTLRLDVIKHVGARLRACGARVRLDTNGQGNLIWNRNIAPELAGVVDAVSVSLNAQDAETYDRICGSRFGLDAYGHVLGFIRACVDAGMEVTASVVDVPEIDITAARRVADGLGVPLRIRGGYGAPRESTS